MPSDTGFHLKQDLHDRPSIMKIILVPSIITLLITLLRLAGEMKGWSEVFFRRSAGGFGALVGIAWLVPVFGIYFALKLAKMGFGPRGALRAVGIVLAALVVEIGVGLVPMTFHGDYRAQLSFMALGAIIGIAIAISAWPALGKTLLAYGLAARIPVAIIMFLAMRGNWGTHYDVSSPDLPVLPFLQKWFWIGLLPQATLWIAYTVLFGIIFGAIAYAVARRRTSPVDVMQSA